MAYVCNIHWRTKVKSLLSIQWDMSAMQILILSLIFFFFFYKALRTCWHVGHTRSSKPVGWFYVCLYHFLWQANRPRGNELHNYPLHWLVTINYEYLRAFLLRRAILETLSMPSRETCPSRGWELCTSTSVCQLIIDTTCTYACNHTYSTISSFVSHRHSFHNN